MPSPVLGVMLTDNRLPRHLVKYSQCMWGCFGMRIFEWVAWVKSIALPRVGGPHPIKDLNGTKRDTLPWGGRTFARLPWARLQTFQSAGSSRNMLFLGLKPASFWTGTAPSALLGLHFADCGCRDFSGSMTLWANSLKSINLILCLSLCLSLCMCVCVCVCVCVCMYVCMYFVFCFHWLFLCRTLMCQFSLQLWAIVKDKEA